MTWIWILMIVLFIALIIMLNRRAEEPEVRHAAPGQGKHPAVKEREQQQRHHRDQRQPGDHSATEIYETPEN